jgi:hypothetical protein
LQEDAPTEAEGAPEDSTWWGGGGGGFGSDGESDSTSEEEEDPGPKGGAGGGGGASAQQRGEKATSTAVRKQPSDTNRLTCGGGQLSGAATCLGQASFSALCAESPPLSQGGGEGGEGVPREEEMGAPHACCNNSRATKLQGLQG